MYSDMYTTHFIKSIFLQATNVPDEVEQILLQQGVVSHNDIDKYHAFIEGVDSLKDVPRSKIKLYKCSTLGIHLINDTGATTLSSSYYATDYIGCIVK